MVPVFAGRFGHHRKYRQLSTPLLRYLREAGINIAVINPIVVKSLLRVEGKSDKGDLRASYFVLDTLRTSPSACAIACWLLPSSRNISTASSFVSLL